MSLKVIAKEKRSVFDRAGNPIFGVITDEIALAVGCRAGEVRLLNGLQGRDSGWGLEHLNEKPSRILQIQQLGFANAESYVKTILAEFTIASLQGDDRILLILEKGSSFHHMPCQWDDEIGAYSVTTAIPKRHARDIDRLWIRT